MKLNYIAMLLALNGFFIPALRPQSVYNLRPVDPHAVYLAPGYFGAHGDGVADDTSALQQAIDRAQETTHQGVVLIAEGRYRLTQTVHVWSGIRLIGYGEKRPILVLGDRTEGFGDAKSSFMLWFTDERTSAGQPIADASEFTFYSGVSNIDFELGSGNHSAVAIRFNVAQHGIITHSKFQLGSARAAIEAAGNQASDIQVSGGQYGIITGKTSPAWQFLLMDSSLDGQSIAAIHTHDAGFTLVRDSFKNVPVAVEIPKGEVEQLYGRELKMEHVSRAVLQVGDIQNLRSEITLERIVCSDVKRFAEGIDQFKGSAAQFPRSYSYFEENFSLGLTIGPDGREQNVALTHRESTDGKSRMMPSDIPKLPPMSEWANVHDLGAKGDGGTDDTTALQEAVDHHSTLYFPSGMYRLTGSLKLRPDTTLIGFSPITTQFILADADPRFEGSGTAIPLLVAPHNGSNVVTGFGIATGNDNPRAAGIEWLASSKSMLDDVDFIRGHSAYIARLEPAIAAPPSQRQPMRLDQQYPSLWVHDGGGGILRGVWSHAGTAKAGLLVENTKTPGAIYQLSCEHHMRVEVRFDHAANWLIYALQTEEEKPEGSEALAVEIESSHDLTFANTYMYRVSRNVLPMPYAVTARNSTNVYFKNVKVFSQTRLAFDNSVFDVGSNVAVRAHDFTYFKLSADLHLGTPLFMPNVFAPGATLVKLASGFSNASGLTAGEDGEIYFSDAAMHTIYQYDETKHVATVLAKEEASPMVLAFVAPSTLLAINNEKSVSQVDIHSGHVSIVQETEEATRGTDLLLPVGMHNELVTLQWMLQHRGYTYRQGSNTALRSELLPEHRGYYYAPDSSIAIMAGGTWRPLLQCSQLAVFHRSDPHYLVSEDDARTYIANLSSPSLAQDRPPAESSKVSLETRPFIERGGTSVVSDADGNVYIAGSQLYVYAHNGSLLGVVEIPERPSCLAIGGRNGNTLYIGARHSIYSLRLRAKLGR